MSKMDPQLIQHEANWVKVDSGFDQIQAGYSGLVCGLKECNVYVRTGVSHDTPMGSGWSVVNCSASEISVGKNCVVRKSDDGTLYMTNITSSLSEPVFLPNWIPIPQCDIEHTKTIYLGEEIKFQYAILDSNDRLFALTSAGEVFGYYSLLDVNDRSWQVVCKPPPVETDKGGIGQRLLSWWKGDQDVLFSHVGVGKGCLWCVREKGNGEVWQLVVSEFTMTNGKLELKPNWVKFQLPINDSIVQLCEDKCTSGELFVVCKNEMEETELVFCSLNKDKPKAKVVIGLPKSCENVSLKSIAICQTQTDTFRATPPPSKKPNVSSLYPSIGALEDSDYCCLNGDCSFCRIANEEGSLITIPSILMPPELESKTETQTIPLASRAENGSVNEQTFYPELRKRKRVNPFSQASESEESFGIYRSKRNKIEHSTLENLLDGVKVACVMPSPMDKV